MSAPAIVTESLTRRFGDFEALKGIDLAVDGPGVFGFLGVNGAGKTTAFRILTGLIRPTSGTVRLFGEDAREVGPALRRRIGYLPQEPAAYPWMTGDEFLRFVGSVFGLKPRQAAARSAELLERCGLTHAAKRKVGGYSGGMKQRLGIAQALVNRPELLLLDEPVSALDPIGRAEVLELVRDLGREVTVFFSSHILADVERVCAEVTIIDAGRIVVREKTAALRRGHLAPVFELVVTGDAGALVGALEKHPLVAEVAPEARDEGETVLRVTVTDLDRGRVELPQVVARAGVPLVSFGSSLPTLEEVFMRMVGRAPVAEAEAEGRASA